MLVKLQLQSVFFIIGGVSHKIGEVMMVLQQWIGWSKSKKEVLQLLLLQLLLTGIIEDKNTHV